MEGWRVEEMRILCGGRGGGRRRPNTGNHMRRHASMLDKKKIKVISSLACVANGGALTYSHTLPAPQPARHTHVPTRRGRTHHPLCHTDSVPCPSCPSSCPCQTSWKN